MLQPVEGDRFYSNDATCAVDEAQQHGLTPTASGQFLVRVSCSCGAVREIEPEALARLVGWKMTLKELALRMRCSMCGKKAAEVVAVARPRPRGVPKNPL